jgi:DNA-binding SARP family transcriptional activator/nucleoid-associated protein YgaU
MIGRLAVRTTAGLALLTLVAGVPAMLAVLIGWPLPSQAPSWDELTVLLTSAPTERLVLNTLAVIAWAVWAAFVASLAAEVVALARHGLTDRRAQPTSRNPVRGLTLLLFTALATGTIGHTTATATQPAPAAAVAVVTEIDARPVGTGADPAVATPHPTPASGGGYLWEDPPPVVGGHRAATIAVEVAGQRHQLPVAAGTTLWDLSEMVLGDARRWPEIRDLNPGCYPSGAGAGQVLLLPDDATIPEAASLDIGAEADDGQDPAAELTYQVAEGDWMWHIAGRYLGDPERYGEIAELNPHLANRYEDYPDHIQPGDELVLPDDARDRGPRTHATGQAGADQAEPPEAPATPSPANPPPESPAGPAQPPPPPPPAASTSPPRPATASPTPVEPSAPPSGVATPAEQPEPPVPADPDNSDDSGDSDDQPGLVLPSGSWISFGLAALVAALAIVLRLDQRRRARLAFPIPPATEAAQPPVPASLRSAEAAGRPQLDLDADADRELAGIMPAPPAIPAAVGIDQHGDPLGLFTLPGELIYLHGAGALPAARAALAAACATGVTDHPLARPQVVTTADILALLLPTSTPIHGLDPDGQTFDGEHLHITPGAAEAIELAEQEMVARWRHLDQNDADTITVLNERDDAEPLPPFLLLLNTAGRHWPRLSTLATHRTSLGIHVIVLDHPGGVPGLQVQADGTVSHDSNGSADQPGEATVERLSTLTADELADLLEVVRQAQPHPEPETGLEPAPDAAPAVPAPAGEPAPRAVEIPRPSGEQPPPVRLQVLGPITLTTDAGPITSGIRTRAYAVLALLAVHPAGRTLEQLADDLHDMAEGVRDMHAALRADINSVRATLRKATGITGKFVLQAGGRYRIDPDLIDVDLWRMLGHIDEANQAGDDDAACLAALQAAAACYQGDFAAGQDLPTFLDHATGYRHQILSVYGKIAEIVELDHPDQAVTVLEKAAELDPVNEELAQRIMRIHGRAGRTEQVRRTLRRLEARLAEMGQAEPSPATRRVAARQLSATADDPQTRQPLASPASGPPR